MIDNYAEKLLKLFRDLIRLMEQVHGTAKWLKLILVNEMDHRQLEQSVLNK